jgi:hypothetical protein
LKREVGEIGRFGDGFADALGEASVETVGEAEVAISGQKLSKCRKKKNRET